MLLRDSIIVIALVMFLVFYGVLVVWQPVAVFDARGNARPFGIGRAQTTVTPLWLCVMMLAVLCYAAAKRMV